MESTDNELLGNQIPLSLSLFVSHSLRLFDAQVELACYWLSSWSLLSVPVPLLCRLSNLHYQEAQDGGTDGFVLYK